MKGRIQDKGAFTGRVGYTHRPCGQGQALSDPMAIESSKLPARVDADVLGWLKSRVRGSGPAPVSDLQPLSAQLSRWGRSEI